MINTKEFFDELIKRNFDMFTGVPDSLLKDFCSCITDNAKKHILTANEGNAIGIASGYNIASNHYGVVYMQNSGLGNAVNPLLSLADEEVYKIPMLLIIGYRGEPNTKDEPQHKKQGMLTLPLLDTLGIKYFILNEDYKSILDDCLTYLEKEKKPVAIVVRKDTFTKYEKKKEISNISLTREVALEKILINLNDDEFVVSTTGKSSREIFEIREKNGSGHSNDFLTVGSMGHTSSIALGMSKGTNKNIYCIDGDGSFIMHMGSLAIAAKFAKDNFKYILINNGAHESVGSQKTIARDINIKGILESFGFNEVIEVNTKDEIKESIDKLRKTKLTCLIINTNTSSRSDLGRPTTSPIENKNAFQNKLRGTK